MSLNITFGSAYSTPTQSKYKTEHAARTNATLAKPRTA